LKEAHLTKLITLLIFLSLACELDLDSPLDPKADSYQGYETVDNINAIQAIEVPGVFFFNFPLGVTPCVGAAEYQFQISGSTDFTNPVYDEVFSNHTPQIPVAELGEGDWYWRARAAKADGFWGEWITISELNLATAPFTSLTPADGGSTTDTTPEFSWDAVVGADHYEIQIADSEAGVSSATAATTSTASFTPASSLANNASHYWRVRAVNSDGESALWSSIQEVQISWGSITGMSPVDGGSTTDTTPEFSWDDVVGADHYEIQIADSEAGVESSTAIDCSTNSHELTETLANGDQRWWRVRAIDGDGHVSLWSDIVVVVVVVPEIGDSYQGGVIFFIDENNEYPFDGLIAAESDLGSYEWGGYGTTVGGTSTAIGTGEANTAAIVATYGANEPYDGLSNYAAKLCYDLVLNGYDVWFLPSKDELNLLYQQRTLVGGFGVDGYWSSSEDQSSTAWRQYFYDGDQNDYSKKGGKQVRAVRAFNY
jgi:hypothetical protein